MLDMDMFLKEWISQTSKKQTNTKTYTTYKKKTHTLRVTLLWHQWAEHVCVLMGTRVWWMYNVMLMSVI